MTPFQSTKYHRRGCLLRNHYFSVEYRHIHIVLSDRNRSHFEHLPGTSSTRWVNQWRHFVPHTSTLLRARTSHCNWWLLFDWEQPRGKWGRFSRLRNVEYTKANRRENNEVEYHSMLQCEANNIFTARYACRKSKESSRSSSFQRPDTLIDVNYYFSSLLIAFARLRWLPDMSDFLALWPSRPYRAFAPNSWIYYCWRLMNSRNLSKYTWRSVFLTLLTNRVWSIHDWWRDFCDSDSQALRFSISPVQGAERHCRWPHMARFLRQRDNTRNHLE